MRYMNKTIKKSWILKLYGSLVIGFLSIFFMTSLSFAKHIHKPIPNVINCGDIITTDTKLRGDLNCDEAQYEGDGPALIVDGATLDLNGYSVIGNPGINCIEMTGGATLRNGAVVNCKEGILIEGDGNKIFGIKASNNERRGFRITSNENWLYNCSAKENGRKGFSLEDADNNLLHRCSAMNNGQQGFSIEGGDGNEIYRSQAKANCRDGIEIDEGNGNSILNNLVEDNGNQEACEEKGEDYNPWFYAGIDITSKNNNSNNNEIKNNSACGNLGCVPCSDQAGEPTCKARERHFWDENVDAFGDSISTNVWENNRVVCKNVEPEFSPEPED